MSRTGPGCPPRTTTPPLWENQETWEGEWWNTKHRELHVFRDVTGMRGEMPDYLIDEIERAESQPMVEDLDI